MLKCVCECVRERGGEEGGWVRVEKEKKILVQREATSLHSIKYEITCACFGGSLFAYGASNSRDKGVIPRDYSRPCEETHICTS